MSKEQAVTIKEFVKWTEQYLSGVNISQIAMDANRPYETVKEAIFPTFPKVTQPLKKEESWPDPK